MKKTVRLLSLILLVVMSLTLVPAAQQKSKNDKERRREERDAARYYEKWLNEDVLYLISEEEKEIFKKLSTFEEKDRFIEQFWRSRDTDLTTAANEYREEHYRRIAYTNQKFGSGIPGWKTDRGRIYIMFGEPDKIDYNAGSGTYVRAPHEGGGRTSTYPFELWYYHSLPGVGDEVEIEFVDRSFTGEFKMAIYPWEKDMLMHVDGLGETTSERLGMTSRHERPGLHPGHLNNATYMAKYMGTRFKDRPFERIRQYFALQRPPQIKQKELQDIVETRVSFQQLDFTAEFHSLWIDESTALVPITLEVPNKSLAYIPQGDTVKARIGIYGRVTSMTGEVKSEFEDIVASQFPARYLENILAKGDGALYQKTVSLEPGRYKIDLVVKDFNSNDIGTIVQSVSLGKIKPGELTPGPVILAEQLESLDAFPETPTTFVIGDVRVVPKVGRRFTRKEPVGIYFQVYYPTLDSSTYLPAVEVDYELVKGGKVVRHVKDDSGRTVHFYSPQRLVLVNRLDLSDLESGDYRLQITVKDTITGESISSRADFEVKGD